VTIDPDPDDPCAVSVAAPASLSEVVAFEAAPASEEVPPSEAAPPSEQEPPSEQAPLSGPNTLPDQAPAVLRVRGLDVSLPGGAIIVEGGEITVAAGRIVSLLGPSGSGKSTLLEAIVRPAELRRRGYRIAWTEHRVEAPVAFIPQRGALFDHLDVAGNIALAQAAGGSPVDVHAWLSAVDLDAALAHPGTPVASLSGGQAQRLAVARTLAAGRTILVLDEPSVGLDPLGVRRLARLLVQQARERDVAILIITHDLALAAGASDAIVFLDPGEQRLAEVLPGWPGPAELAPDDVRRAEIERLDVAVSDLLSSSAAPAARPGVRVAAPPGGPGPLHVAGAAVRHLLNPTLAGPSARVMLRAIRQSLLRPLPFYVVVGALLGFTVLYIIAKMSADLRAVAVLRLVGGTYILSLAPPLSAILFAATSGNAINAWLGGMQLGRQILALDGIGVPAARYLWSPAWIGLSISYLLTVLVFIASMVGGGFILFQLYGARDALSVLTSDFLDPAPGRGPYLIRGIWLSLCYAVAIATIVVGSGVAHKDEAAHVTSAMTSAVVRATLFVVAMELASVLVLFAVTGR
jgi:ABC-type nitrate/sulfonate/bicarbonate transport system ATPase subunit/ABC-type transporter Mla maintaining outer membrane lipid asymmetry permease subunit MlaE